MEENATKSGDRTVNLWLSIELSGTHVEGKVVQLWASSSAEDLAMSDAINPDLRQKFLGGM